MQESAALAERLSATSCARQDIAPGQLTIHADRGSSMRSKPVALLLADLGVTKTHSRPSVSNDNPFSEAQFKTLKYRPDFPERFGALEHARRHSADFFPWYNTEHRHGGLGLHTPHDVHYGLAEARRAQRALVRSAAYAARPDRFVHHPPMPAPLPTAVWKNPPKLLVAIADVAQQTQLPRCLKFVDRFRTASWATIQARRSRGMVERVAGAAATAMRREWRAMRPWVLRESTVLAALSWPRNCFKRDGLLRRNLKGDERRRSWVAYRDLDRDRHRLCECRCQYNGSIGAIARDP